MDSVERIVSNYFHMEHENLGLFYYVTEVSSDVNKLVDEVNKIKEDIVKLERQSGGTHVQQDEQLRKLEVTLY